ncbi:hypothetical protein ABID21_004879 [Pseudorhizobium tarimense]|uniref:Uncharacterized protein n=1 Tax=Pseudorhizobium tarimense TaxID=1079109 RepID=A0ABV2HDW9_9HYPH
MPDLRGCGGLMDGIAGEILEQGGQIDLLLIMSADFRAGLLPNDREDRLMVQASVIKTRYEVGGTGPEVAIQTPSSPENLA